MDSNTIKPLLEKYWEGETTLKEEKQLRVFFNSADVPAELESVKPLFVYLNNEQEAYLNGDFDERLSSKLRPANNKQPRRAIISMYIKRIAAVAAIFIGILFFMNKDIIYPAEKQLVSEMSIQEKTEARVAYKEAKSALMLLSKKLNKGTGKAKSGIAKVRKATKVIR